MEAFLTFLSVIGTVGILSFIAKWATSVAQPHVDAALEKKKIEKQVRDAEEALAKQADAERLRIEKEKRERELRTPVDQANDIIKGD